MVSIGDDRDSVASVVEERLRLSPRLHAVSSNAVLQHGGVDKSRLGVVIVDGERSQRGARWQQWLSLAIMAAIMGRRCGNLLASAMLLVKSHPSLASLDHTLLSSFWRSMEMLRLTEKHKEISNEKREWKKKRSFYPLKKIWRISFQYSFFSYYLLVFYLAILNHHSNRSSKIIEIVVEKSVSTECGVQFPTRKHLFYRFFSGMACIRASCNERCVVNGFCRGSTTWHW